MSGAKGYTGLPALICDTRPACSTHSASRFLTSRNERGKRVLAEKLLPRLHLVSGGQALRAAQQLCPEEFSSVIGAGIKLQSVTIELAPDAPLLKRLDIRAPWLDEIRVDQREHVTGGVTTFAEASGSVRNRRGCRPARRIPKANAVPGRPAWAAADNANGKRSRRESRAATK
jgi:hypothetical protein